MTTINVKGYEFEYTEQGSGEPLVLVHGSASDYRTWSDQFYEFARRYRTIRYSRRYHWPNEQIPEGADYSMAEHVDDLGALVHELDARPAHFVGHSYGAFVCLLLAMRAPELVRTLVLAEPPVITLFVSNQPQPRELAKLLLTRPRTAVEVLKFGSQGVAPATKAFERGDREAALEAFARAVLGHQAFDGLSPARRQQAWDNLIDAELLGSGFPPLKDDDLGAVQAPALLLAAQQSPRIWHRLLDRLEELLPEAERVEILDASHIMHEDNRDAYNRAVLSFLARHRATAPKAAQRDALMAGTELERSRQGM
ncbi:MAG: alpha/beta fold hydrolase [Anaerolineae bacterium]